MSDTPRTAPAEIEKLIERLRESARRIGKMCSEHRGPRMSVPVQDTDDDVFISAACLEAADALSAGHAAQQGRGEAKPAEGWRCYWCNVLFTDRAKAEIHFGRAHSGKPTPECYRLLEREIADLRAPLAQAEQNAAAVQAQSDSTLAQSESGNLSAPAAAPINEPAATMALDDAVHKDEVAMYRAAAPDANCITLPNGDCIGGTMAGKSPCMHDDMARLERELAAAQELLEKNEGRIKKIVDEHLLLRAEQAEKQLAAAMEITRKRTLIEIAGRCDEIYNAVGDGNIWALATELRLLAAARKERRSKGDANG